MVISRLRLHHVVAYPIYSGRARSAIPTRNFAPRLSSLSSYLSSVTATRAGCDATVSRPPNAPPSTPGARAYKHLNIYETFIRVCATGRAIDSAFRTAFDFERPVCVVRRYHRRRRRRQPRRRHFAPPRTTFFHLSATPVFAIARLRTGALFFRCFSFGWR